MADRRLAILKIEPQFALDAFKGLNERRPSWAISKNALPDDAEVAYIGYDPNEWPQVVNVAIRSQSFEDVPAGKPLPILEPIQFTTYYGPFDGRDNLVKVNRAEA